MDFVKHYHSLTHLPIPETEEVRLDIFLKKILNLIKPECEKNQITMNLEVRENPVIFLDPKLIQQVVINLLKNSIHALEGISPGRNIWITAARYGDSGAQISVKDNGCGIDTANMDNIFIPFFTTLEKGSGIGLSLAKQIMRLHNGQISVKSETGKGAEFILRF